jgi:hypothetical protein
MNPNAVTITPVGSAGQSYDVRRGADVFRITTRSSRRFLVVSLRGRYVALRTDNPTTAEARRRRDPLDLIVIDRRVHDALGRSHS